jgi:uncharacterized Zn-finger protein
MAHFETILVEQHTVACNGGGGALGHPRVYLRIKAGESEIECPYCSRRYVYDKQDGEKAESERA